MSTHPQTRYFERGRIMIADSNSNIAWHRVQLRKKREALKALEIARFRIGENDRSRRPGAAEGAWLISSARSAESLRCIAAHERQTKRPLATDLRSLAQVSWGSWDANGRSRQGRIAGVAKADLSCRNSKSVGALLRCDAR